MYRMPTHARYRIAQAVDDVRDGTVVWMLVEEFEAAAANDWVFVAQAPDERVDLVLGKSSAAIGASSYAAVTDQLRRLETF
jgi:hypothetical protein